MKKPANVEQMFAWSVTFMVSLASMILAFAEESKLPTSLTPFLAVFCHYFVDRWKRIRLRVWMSNVLGLLAFAAMTFEFVGANVLDKLLSGAHLLVYMTWVILLMQKGIRQYWWLLALSVLQVSVASVLTTDAAFGVSLVFMLFVMVWTTSVFTLFRARQRVSDAEVVEDSLEASERKSGADILQVKDGLQLDSREPWIGWRFRFIVGFTFVASLLVAGVTFAAFPRIWVPESPLAALRQPLSAAFTHQTGFTDTVKLGEIGEIMQSDARALQFEIESIKDGSSVTPEQFATAMGMDEILFRGNALGRYENGSWTSGSSRGRMVSHIQPYRGYSTRAADSDFRVKITQDPPIHTFAFAPHPVTNAVRKGPGRLPQRGFSYSIVHQFKERHEQLKSEPSSYEVWCQAASPGQKVHLPGRPRRTKTSLLGLVEDLVRPRSRSEQLESDFANAWCISRNLEASLPELTRIATQRCTNEFGELVTPRERVQKIMFYLNGSGEFKYSHTLNISDPSLDPVEDFLLNQKSGHCEYFASAAALMMQAVGVPARVVNGYKGSHLNEVSGHHEVKQRYAHTWTEAYVDRQWETYDPTPASAREEIVNQTRQLDWWNDLRLAFSDNWMDIIQKMSLQRQEAMIRPWLDSLKKLWATVKQQGVVASLKMFYEEVILQPGKWVSVRTGVVTFIVLLILGLLLKSNPFKRPIAAIRNAILWFAPDRSQQRTVIRFYENFKTICSKNGLSLPSNQTAQEHAVSAAKFFEEKLPAERDRSLPIQIARTFNSVRFGNLELTAESVASIRADVSRFSELLRNRNS